VSVKENDRQRSTIFEDQKILLLQPSDRMMLPIGYHYIEKDLAYLVLIVVWTALLLD
jgi:hypothetical protein